MATMEKLTHVSEINQLISKGKEKGYLTYEEINDVLPSDVVTPDQIDDLMHLFGENEIDIVDTSTKGEKIAAAKGERDKDESSGGIPASKSDTVSIDDPVRLYLREMGTISLLTRKGEVELAKKIEAGQDEVNAAVASCAVTTRELIAMAGEVKKGEIRIFDLIRTPEPEEDKEQSAKDETKNFMKKVRKLKSEFTKFEKLQDKLDSGKLSEKMQAKATDQLQKQHKDVENIISSLTLSIDEMDGLIEKIYGIAGEYREAGKQEKTIEKQLGMSLAGIKKLAKNWAKQKSVKLPKGKVITRTQYDNHIKLVQTGRREVKKIEKETLTSKDSLLATVRSIARGRVKEKTAKRSALLKNTPVEDSSSWT